MRQTSTGGYDPKSNGDVENRIGIMLRMMKAAHAQSGVPFRAWDTSYEHAQEVYVRLPNKSHGKEPPLLQELRDVDPATADEEFAKEDVSTWAGLRDRVHGLRAQGVAPREAE